MLGYLKRQAGQGMTEYIVVVALVAVAALKLTETPFFVKFSYESGI